MRHTDCHIVKRKIDNFFRIKPIILGHEVAGTVTKLGDGTGDKLGDRVAISLLFHPADKGNRDRIIGVALDGGNAEYILAPASRLTRIVNGVSFI